MINQYAYDLANKQRFVALKNAFDTIRVFAEPSLDPESFKHFEDLEKNLLENYGKDVEMDLVKKILNDGYEDDVTPPPSRPDTEQ